MKLLIFEWGAYTQPDINACFDQCNITYRIVSYHFSNKNEDPFFSHRFPKFLAEDAYDAVFSVNYFPLVAQCCYEHNIPQPLAAIKLKKDHPFRRCTCYNAHNTVSVYQSIGN